MSTTFTIYTGPMFSGKTTALLQALEKLKYQQKTCILFKPAIDNRYSKIGDASVITHTGWTWPALQVKDATDLIETLTDLMNTSRLPDAVAVDEAFMIPGVSSALIDLYKCGTSIYVSSLDMSSTCEPFGEIVKMLPWATHIYKSSAVCTVCRADAFYTYRKPSFGDAVIVIGGDEAYEPRCLRHHPSLENIG